jgi:hypothetical protein
MILRKSMSLGRPSDRIVVLDALRGVCFVFMRADPGNPLLRFSNANYGPFGFFTAALYLIERIVQLAGWRAQDQDAWHGYRFYERWAGAHTPEALEPTFARYEAEDIGRALRAKGEILGELERDVAKRFGLVEPVDRGEILRRLDGLLAHDLA